MFTLCLYRDYVPETSAFAATQFASTGDIIRFPAVQLNTGGDYNSSSGVFTCRIPGLYWFSVSLSKQYGPIVNYVGCFFTINGSKKVYLYEDPTQDIEGYTTTGSIAVHLNVGDRVYVGGCYNQPIPIWNYDATYFSGMLVKPDM